MRSALATFKSDDAALLMAVPDDFREAARRYHLRADDEQAWRGRTKIENAVWLIEVLAARLADEQSFSAHIVQLAKHFGEEFKDQRRKV
jgi:hypothetical protein